LNLDFELFLTELKQIATELNEVKAELRIRSLIKAADILRNSDDFKARLLASYTVGFAGEQVLSFLRSEEVKKFTRPMLRQENLLSTVQNYVTLAKESSGELSHKAQLLYMGMHWWMRGRYGEGPEGMGLLKAVVPRNGERNRGNNRGGNRAVNGASGGGIAQFALFMPMKPPKPTTPAAYGYNVPKFDRRHHYIWMYEYRRLTTRNTSVVKNSNREVTSKTQLSQFY